MLWWAAAAAVPFIIHLLSRRKFRRVPWGAMQFLLAALKRTRRRLRMENILLMLLRMGIFLALATAFANPQIGGGGLLGAVAGGSRTVILALDSSFSMQARDDQDRTAWSEATKTARSVLATLDSQKDAAALLTFGSPVHLETRLTRDLALVRRRLDALDPAEGTTDLLGGLHAIEGLLAEPGLEEDFPGEKTILLITDLQKSAFLDHGSSAEEGGPGGDADPELLQTLRRLEDRKARVIAVGVGGGAVFGNVAVTELANDGRAFISGLTGQIQCRIENFGDRTTSGELRLYLDNEESYVQSRRVVDLPGLSTGSSSERERVVNFDLDVPKVGWHHLMAQWVDDSLAVDNRRRLAFRVRDHLKVLAVSGGGGRRDALPATFYAARALDPLIDDPLRSGGSFVVKEISSIAFPSEKLDGYDLVILANVSEIPAAKAMELEEWVRQGGGLLYFPGPSLEGAGRIGRSGGVVNQLFFRGGQGLLPYPITRLVGSDEFTESPFNLQFESFDHPVAKYFEDPRIQPGLTRIPVYKLAATEPVENAVGVRAIASFFPTGKGAETGERYPALVEKRLGEGACMFFATSADTAWNIYGATPAFVPFMREIAYALTRRRELANLLVGATLVEDFPPSVTKIRLTVGDAPAEERAPVLSADKSRAEVSLRQIPKSGVVVIDAIDGADQLSETERHRVAVINPDTSESNVEPADSHWLADQFGRDLLLVIDDPTELSKPVDEAAKGGLWRLFLYAALAFLLVETLLAWKFGSVHALETSS